MRRREFITVIGGSAAAWPLVANAQLASKLATVGFLSPNSQAVAQPWTAAFVERLRDLGWIEDRTVQIEYRWEDGLVERSSEFVNELVGLKVDVIATHGVPNIVGAMKATSTISSSSRWRNDPVRQLLRCQSARPGLNVTELSIQSRDLAGKRLELLGELFPALHRVALMGDQAARLEMGTPGAGDLRQA